MPRTMMVARIATARTMYIECASSINLPPECFIRRQATPNQYHFPVEASSASSITCLVMSVSYALANPISLPYIPLIMLMVRSAKSSTSRFSVMRPAARLSMQRVTVSRQRDRSITSACVISFTRALNIAVVISGASAMLSSHSFHWSFVMCVSFRCVDCTTVWGECQVISEIISDRVKFQHIVRLERTPCLPLHVVDRDGFVIVRIACAVWCVHTKKPRLHRAQQATDRAILLAELHTEHHMAHHEVTDRVGIVQVTGSQRCHQTSSSLVSSSYSTSSSHTVPLNESIRPSCSVRSFTSST